MKTDRKQIEELLRFLPLLDVPGRAYVERWEGEPKAGERLVQLPFPVYCKDVEAFFKVARSKFWMDSDYEPEEAGRLVRSDEAIRKADLPTIKTMLTWCMRGEHFCTGAWEDVLKSGMVVMILKGLKELREQME